MIVIPPAQETDGWMPIQQGETPNATDASSRLSDRFTNNTGAMATIVVPGLATRMNVKSFRSN